MGYLQSVDTADGTAVFHPLQLPPTQKARAEAYIQVRDVYQQLYTKEAQHQLNTKKKGKTLTDCTMPLSKGMAI
ncbi:hypothetical protein EJ377_16825 [Chryseobacterium arthrosphaerae]|uniref:Uncharacterized protein n=1 Tax=Chryseobacterium arthrosphaerae TaxID=651561 RepID=A0A3S0N4V9_9FLAO|nr:hypothetical protein EJ377_16825 [Chryseobacterium arthrosphaerae]